MGMFRIAVFILFSLAWPSFAQTLFDLSKTIESVKTDTLYSLTGKVLPGSIRVYAGHQVLTKEQWRADFVRNTWSLIDSTYSGKTIQLFYKAYPALRLRETLPQPYIQIPLVNSTVTKDSLLKVEKLKYQRADLFGDTKIQREGSIRRGIIIGSNRDASLESGLRLDLSGPISDEVYLLATLTDQNIPIQPEGSTQTLREFDKVYLSVKHPKVHLQLGDIDVMVDSSAFTSLNRRLQGADLRIQTQSYSQRLTASQARGTYRSQTIPGIEAVQGPYRLNGNQNETFIVVLAGSEKVYVDGLLLTRGEDHDYVIDYSLGEITFTDKLWITAKSRILVDFQYLNQGYARSLLSAESGVKGMNGGKWDLMAHLVREADSDHPLSQWSLTASDLNILRLSGDETEKALVSTVTPFENNSSAVQIRTEQIRYERVDTLVMGQQVYFYRVTNQPTKPAYSVSFVRSRNGMGAYTRANSTANGFTYRWVGKGLGEYDTLKTLIAPQSKQILSLQTRYRINHRSQFYSEMAGSQWDQNRFSGIDDQDNTGFAWKGGIQWASTEADKPGYRMDLNHQFISRRFTFLDRSRPVDFDRTWNLTSALNSNEHLTQARVFWNPLPRTSLRMDMGGLRYRDAKSRRIQLGIQSEETDNVQLQYSLDAVDTQQPLPSSSGQWIRQQAQSSHSWQRGEWVITPGVRYVHELRKQTQGIQDSLVLGSLRYHSLSPSVRIRATQRPTLWSWSGEYRVDYQPMSGTFVKESISLAQNLGFQYEKSANFSTEHHIGLRQIDYDAPLAQDNNPAQTRNLQLKSNVQYRLFRQLIQGNWTYDVRSERKARLQERYFEVGAELGSFIWEDLNKNGIQELDEFFPERIPGEGNFILQFIPGDIYIPITTLDAGVRHTLRFNTLDSGNIPEFLQRLEVSSRISLKESTTDAQRNVLLLRWNTFQGKFTQLGRWSTNHDVRIPLTEGRPGVRLFHDYIRSSNQTMLGLDKSKRNALQATLDYRFSDRWYVDVTGRSSQYEQESENLQNRNVNMSAYHLEPELQLQWSKTVTSAVRNRWIVAKDVQLNSKADLKAWEIMINTHYYFSNTSRAFVQLSRRSNNISGETTSYALYELTEGGAAGTVWTGNLSIEHRVSDVIRASLHYDLKSIPKAPLLQILRFNVTAIL